VELTGFFLLSIVSLLIFVGWSWSGLVLGYALVRKERARRRVSDGRCTACAYPAERLDHCPECGGRPDELPGSIGRFVTRIVAVDLVVLTLAAAAGAIAAESWIRADELAFVREAERVPADTGYSRPRAWPHGNASLLKPSKGPIRATE